MSKNLLYAIIAVVVIALGFWAYNFVTGIFTSKDYWTQRATVAERGASDWKQKFETLDSTFQFQVSASVNSVRGEILEEAKKKFPRDPGFIRALQHIVDSLKEENFELRSVSTGSGTLTILGGGQSDSMNHFEDAWITLDAKIAGNRLEHINYDFSFDIGDVRTNFERDADGRTLEVYDVFLKSKRDSTMTLYLPYRRESFNQLPSYSRFKFWDPRLNVSALWGGQTVELAATISLSSYSDAPDANGMILALPDIGISSNFEDQTYFIAGGRFNMAHFLPLLTNVHLTAHAGLPTNNLNMTALVGRIGIGVGL